MSLSLRYQKLLDLFDQVLSLSHMILSELEREETQENLKDLIGKKDAAGRSIAKLTDEIASTEIDTNSESSLRTLAEIKPILKQIEQKASLLQAVEGRIKDLVKRNKKR
jgi:hypothetical protein